MGLPEHNDVRPENEPADQDDRLVAALREPPLRAALLALGMGAIWAALSRWRRRRPHDLW